MPEVLASRGDGGPALLLRLLRYLERRSQRVAHRTVTVNEYLRDRLVQAGATEVDVGVRNGPVLRRAAAAVASPAVRGQAAHLLVWAGKMGRQDRVDLVVRLAEYARPPAGPDRLPARRPGGRRVPRRAA